MRNRVSIVLYRSILRWHNLNKDVPFHIRQLDIASVSDTSLFNDTTTDTATVPTVADIARKTFRHRSTATGDDLQIAHDKGFAALRHLNIHYSRLVDTMRESRSQHINHSDEIKFPIGTVFQHKKFGYKGVIYGWDATCRKDQEWIRSNNVQPNQPFYLVLPDELDYSSKFTGRSHLYRYVAQENIEPLTDSATRIIHRKLGDYFTGYSLGAKRYVPDPAIQYQYPDDEAYGKLSSVEGEIVSVEEDTNILAVDDRIEENDDGVEIGSESGSDGEEEDEGEKAVAVCSEVDVEKR